MTTFEVTCMELQPASPALIEAVRPGSTPELPALPGVEARSVVNYRVPASRVTAPAADEVLIPDQRADLTPAQSVERKLTTLLRDGAIPASHFRLARLCRRP
jgi:hypothetical protein